MITYFVVKLLLKVKGFKLLHFLFYGIPFVLAVTVFILALDFTDGAAFLNSIQTVEGIAAVVLAVILGNGFVRFIYFLTLHKLYDGNVITNSYGTAVKVGQPGDGKSSVGIYDAYILAQYNFSELQKDYYLMGNRLAELRAAEDVEALDEWEQVKAAYEFYVSNVDKYIPCLYSNVPIVDKSGRRSYYCLSEVFDQEEKIPQRAVIFVDEIGQLPNLNVDVIRKERNVAASHFFRFCRQYGEFRIVATEQDPKNIYIDCRRNAKNRYMLGQRPALKPLLLTKLKDFLIRKGIQKGITNPVYVAFVQNLHILCKRMGFRVFRYCDVGNVELGNVEKVRIKTGAIPYYTEFTYDDRYFRYKYAQRNEALPSLEEK